MADKNMSPQTILLGAVLGGLLGTAAAQMMSSKNSKSFTDNLGDYGDKIKNMIQDLNSNIADNISDGAECLSEKAQDMIQSIKDEVSDDLESKDFRKGVAIGAILGGLMGAGGACLYNGREKEGNWKKVAKDVLEVLDIKGCQEKRPKSKSMSDMLDFAVSGITLWKNLQKRK